MIGDQCGKSSLIQRFLYDEFTADEDPTVEKNFEVNFNFSEKEQHLRILDTSGQDQLVENNYLSVYTILSKPLKPILIFWKQQHSGSKIQMDLFLCMQ